MSKVVTRTVDVQTGEVIEKEISVTEARALLADRWRRRTENLRADPLIRACAAAIGVDVTDVENPARVATDLISCLRSGGHMSDMQNMLFVLSGVAQVLMGLAQTMGVDQTTLSALLATEASHAAMNPDVGLALYEIVWALGDTESTRELVI